MTSSTRGYQDSEVPPTKNVLLRLDPALAEELSAVAAVEGRPVSEVVREAIRLLLDDKKRDKKFQAQLKREARRHAALLGKLREP